ncbi:MAG: pentapeptide repeat-containing protein [Verrucomicrobiae bacterium]|nr:pentapeptide repeat-containing protein [Verrucomicrobiae bacterium]
MNIQIKCRFTGSVLFEHDCKDNTIKLTVLAAFEKKISLANAYLRGADLSGAYLSGAYLRGADLSGAYLRGAYLSGAYLRGADLSGAYLRGADLSGADLSGAKLKNGEIVGESDRPFFTLGPIGSAERMLYAFSTDKGIRLQTGCFFGTVEEFEAQLKTTHGKNEHAREYEAAMELIQAHFKIWKPKK